MPMSRKKKSRERPPGPAFCTQVDGEEVERLLCRFVALVKRGLELMLTAPSEFGLR